MVVEINRNVTWDRKETQLEVEVNNVENNTKKFFMYGTLLINNATIYHDLIILSYNESSELVSSGTYETPMDIDPNVW